MSERSPEVDRVDESIVGGSGSALGSDIAGAGSDGSDTGVADGAEEGVADSHAADVAAGFDDPDHAPVQPSTEEDGSL